MNRSLFYVLPLLITVLYSCNNNDDNYSDTNGTTFNTINEKNNSDIFEFIANSKKIAFDGNISFYRNSEGYFSLTAYGSNRQHFNFKFHESGSYGGIFYQSSDLNEKKSPIPYFNSSNYIGESLNFEIIKITEKSVIGEFSGTLRTYPSDEILTVSASFDIPFRNLDSPISNLGLLATLNGDDWYSFGGYDSLFNDFEDISIEYINDTPFQLAIIIDPNELKKGTFTFDNSSKTNMVKLLEYSNTRVTKRWFSSVEYEIINKGELLIKKIIDLSTETNQNKIIEGSFSFKAKNPDNDEIIQVVSKKFIGQFKEE